MTTKTMKPTLVNPLDPVEKVEFNIPGEIAREEGGYEEAMREGWELIQRPVGSVSIEQIEKQHAKKRMTVWERIGVLSDQPPNILFQNWGKNLDGASLVTAVLDVNGRDVSPLSYLYNIQPGSLTLFFEVVMKWAYLKNPSLCLPGVNA